MKRSSAVRGSRRCEYENNLENNSVLNIEPMAASSPKNSPDQLNAEDASIIKKVKEKVEGMKREVSRMGRLQRFRIGAELAQHPFSLQAFAKNFYDYYYKAVQDKTLTMNSGFSTLSFTNFASSSGYDKNSSIEARNKMMNRSRNNTRNKREVLFKDLPVKENVADTNKTERTLRGRSSRNKKDTTKSGESSISSCSFKSIKKTGSRAVALVTPGPDANKPMSVLRRPTAGELAISLFGSPLLVAPDCAPTKMPQINLPTADGKVVAILPRDGFTVDDLPLIATPTRFQLKTLNKYLNVLCDNQG